MLVVAQWYVYLLSAAGFPILHGGGQLTCDCSSTCCSPVFMSTCVQSCSTIASRPPPGMIDSRTEWLGRKRCKCAGCHVRLQDVVNYIFLMCSASFSHATSFFASTFQGAPSLCHGGGLEAMNAEDDLQAEATFTVIWSSIAKWHCLVSRSSESFV